MKSVLMSVAIVVQLFLVEARSQVVWDSANVGGVFALNDVAMTSASVGFVVGDSGTVAKTTDGGRTWVAQSVDPLRSIVAVAFQDPLRGIIAGTSIARYTTNGGATWLSPPALTGVGTKSVAWGAQNTCVGVGTGGQIMRTTNGGASWTTVVTTTSQSLYGVAFSDSTHAVAVGSSKIVRSTDGGLTWLLAATPSGFLWDIASPTPHGLVAVGYKFSPIRGAVYRSSDDGVTWDSLIVTTGSALRSVTFCSPDTGYALSAVGTVFRTTNGGALWDSVSVLPVATTMGSIAAADPRSMLVSNDRGNVYRITRGPNAVAPDHDVPSVFTLSQNFPNPFNPITQIAFVLPVDAHVRLAVHDLLGREIALLVDGPMAAGQHTVPFHASPFSSGVYIYTIEAGGFTASKPMLLVR